MNLMSSLLILLMQDALTPLFVSMQKEGCERVVNYLLSVGADVNATNKVKTDAIEVHLMKFKPCMFYSQT